ncbi:hypothetical protein MrNuV_ORF086 [Macrobrachium rosenbergii nudivirus]|nr:hypothetical protein MrNuV_ORF086 [Macrobrachium rosenbergii nudivirus]
MSSNVSIIFSLSILISPFSVFIRPSIFNIIFLILLISDFNSPKSSSFTVFTMAGILGVVEGMGVDVIGGVVFKSLISVLIDLNLS